MSERVKHTRGPWQIDKRLIHDGEYKIASVSNRRNQEESEANLAIIKAAPEMYKACKGIMDAIKRNHGELYGNAITLGGLNIQIDEEEELLPLELAIAKAEGKS